MKEKRPRRKGSLYFDIIRPHISKSGSIRFHKKIKNFFY